ncbi:hypothetical protein BJ170DRAFT_728867 [Xylariales sp. AK1849]|nr:hypothetical protein BJ170DRAFT_728867 [Xylariales sp. AK1849]
MVPSDTESPPPPWRPRNFPSNWHLVGFVFASGQDPMQSVQHVRTILQQRTYMPGRRDRGKKDSFLRFETNLRVMLEAVYHFSAFWGQRDFWTRIREVLGFHHNTSEENLQDIVARYCAGRRALRNSWASKHHRPDHKPVAPCRIAGLADIIDSLSVQHTSPISHGAWSDRKTSWTFPDHEPSWTQRNQARFTKPLSSDSASHIAPVRRGKEVAEDQIPSGAHILGQLRRHNQTGEGARERAQREKCQRLGGDGAHEEKGFSRVQSLDKLVSRHAAVQQPSVAKVAKAVDASEATNTRKRLRSADVDEVDISSKRLARNTISTDSSTASIAQSEDLQMKLPIPTTSTRVMSEPTERNSVTINKAEDGSMGVDEDFTHVRTDPTDKPLMAESTGLPKAEVAPENILTSAIAPRSSTGTNTGVQSRSPPIDQDGQVEEPEQESKRYLNQRPQQAQEPASQVYESEAADDIRGLLARLESCQHRLDGKESSMDVLQKQLAQRSSEQERIASLESEVKKLHGLLVKCSPDQEQIESLGIQVRDLRDQLHQRSSEQSRVEGLESSVEQFQPQLNQRVSEQQRVKCSDLAIKSFQDQVGQQFNEEKRLESLELSVRGLQENARHSSSEETLFRTLELSVECLESQLSEVSSEEQRLDSMESIVNVFQDGLGRCASKTRVDDLVLMVKGVQDQIRQHASEKRVASVESAIRGLQDRLGQRTSMGQIDGLKSELKGIQDQLGQSVSGKQVQKVQLTIRHLEDHHTSTMQRLDSLESCIAGLGVKVNDQSATEQQSERFEIQLRDIREHIDHCTTMYSKASETRLTGFQKQLTDMQEQIASVQRPQPSMEMVESRLADLEQQSRDTQNHKCQLRKLPSISTSSNDVQSQLADLEHQFKAFQEQLRHHNSVPRITPSPSVPNVKSLASRNTRGYLTGVLSELNKIRMGMRAQIREMDAAHMPDDDRKLAISDVSWELRQVEDLAKRRINAL